MRVYTDRRDYTLYIDSKGQWTMHEWDPRAQPGYQWQETYHNVSAVNPFLSGVEYDAWS